MLGPRILLTGALGHVGGRLPGGLARHGNESAGVLGPIHGLTFRGLRRRFARRDAARPARGAAPAQAPAAGADDRVDWVRCLPFIGIHLLCLAAIWTGVEAAA